MTWLDYYNQRFIDEHLGKVVLIAAVLAILVTLILCFAVKAHAEEYSDEQIVNAIFQVEGGYKARYLYGIRSVSYRNEAEARRICFNTVRNNRKRYADYGYKQYDTYLEFLASRFCPIGCDNDRGTNKYWLKNVRWFLARSSGR